MIFIDLDGPILDVSDRYYYSYANSLKEIGGRILDKDEYWNLKRTKVPDYDILGKTSSGHLLGEFKIRRNILIEEENSLNFDFPYCISHFC